jgi:hypothetical protein
MNNFSKLMLSDEELQLVNNSGWILTKRVIMDKVNHLFGALSASQQAVIKKEGNWLPPPVVQSSPKISKGENYLQLPYLLLDYPRCFGTADIFAVRTMFWWGNFFSVTLHVSGSYKQMFGKKIIENLRSPVPDIFICTHEEQWHHHFEADNYVHVQQLSQNELRDIILKKQFVKLAQKFSLQQWREVPLLLNESFKEMIDLLKDQLPRR